uniref:Uncharacterized protein n=1 Tax=Caenorhabditis japonica TaxID=281687 RepID=A0A8R1HLY5_CAEJA
MLALRCGDFEIDRSYSPLSSESGSANSSLNTLSAPLNLEIPDQDYHVQNIPSDILKILSPAGKSSVSPKESIAEEISQLETEAVGITEDSEELGDEEKKKDVSSDNLLEFLAENWRANHDTFLPGLAKEKNVKKASNGSEDQGKEQGGTDDYPQEEHEEEESPRRHPSGSNGGSSGNDAASELSTIESSYGALDSLLGSVISSSTYASEGLATEGLERRVSSEPSVCTPSAKRSIYEEPANRPSTFPGAGSEPQVAEPHPLKSAASQYVEPVTPRLNKLKRTAPITSDFGCSPQKSPKTGNQNPPSEPPIMHVFAVRSVVPENTKNT